MGRENDFTCEWGRFDSKSTTTKKTNPKLEHYKVDLQGHL